MAINSKTRLLVVLIFQLLVISSNSQSPCDLIKSYSLSVCNEKLSTESLQYLEKFRKKYPNDSLVQDVNLTLLYRYSELKDFENVKKISLEIIADTGTLQKIGRQVCPWLYDSIDCRRAITIFDDYREIKFKAALFLYDTYFLESRFDSALYYLKMADIEFAIPKWRHYSRNNDLESRVFNNYAKVYEKLNKVDDAIKVLVPHILTANVSDQLLYLLKKYRNIDSLKNELSHLEDYISIEYGIVSENPRTIPEYDAITGRLLRQTSINEYGRIAFWNFASNKFYASSANDYRSNKVRGERKKRKLKPVQTDQQLISNAKAYITEQWIYKAIMNL